MTGKKVMVVYGVVLLIISFPFTVIHLRANPDDAPISTLQHVVAALANFLGPWGVVLVRCVDFPNAGLRAFSWAVALVMTFLAGALVGLGLYVKLRSLQYMCIVVWTAFILLWFGVGLRQIADGLL